MPPNAIVETFDADLQDCYPVREVSITDTGVVIIG
jgi:hypothetical protein